MCFVAPLLQWLLCLITGVNNTNILKCKVDSSQSRNWNTQKCLLVSCRTTVVQSFLLKQHCSSHCSELATKIRLKYSLIKSVKFYYDKAFNCNHSAVTKNSVIQLFIKIVVALVFFFIFLRAIADFPWINVLWVLSSEALFVVIADRQTFV